MADFARKVTVEVELKKSGSLGLEAEAEKARIAEKAVDSLKAKAGTPAPTSTRLGTAAAEAMEQEKRATPKPGQMVPPSPVVPVETKPEGETPRTEMPARPSLGTPAPVFQSERVRGARENARMEAEARASLMREQEREQQAKKMDEARRRVMAADPSLRIASKATSAEKFNKVGQGVALVGASALGAVAAFGGESAAAPAGEVLGGGIGGAAAGAAVGSLIPGGTAIGAMAGGIIGAVGGIFKAITGGSERARQAAERLEQRMGAVADSMLRTERSTTRVRREGATAEDFESMVPEEVRMRIADTPMEGRMEAMRSELDRMRRAEGLTREMGMTGGRGMAAAMRFTASGDVGELISPTRTRAEEEVRSALIAGDRRRIDTAMAEMRAEGMRFTTGRTVLEEGIRRGGIEGITRPESRASPGFGDSLSARDTLLMAAAERVPEVRVPELAGPMAELVRMVSGLVASVGDGVATARPAPVIG